jgi:threonine dehydrogenase-like Zn-dependent dehydrogenase
MAPSTTKAWTVQGQDGFESLKFNEQAEIPEMGDKDVLVKGVYCVHRTASNNDANSQTVHAASLNYRDLVIPKGKYPFPMKDNTVPGSDGAGTVESVGKHVTRFKPGGSYSCADPTNACSLLT